MRLWGLSFVAAGCSLAACAQLLSYDDYRERVVDTGTAEISVAAETAVEDTVAEVVNDSGPQPFRVPVRPAGEATPSGTGRTLWLAVRRYRLGTSDPSGGPADQAWKSYGYDLDEVCTTLEQSTENLGTCRRPAAAQQDSLLDGHRCRDNNFGRHIGGLVRASMPDAEDVLNDTVGAGTSTWLLRIDDVDSAPNDTYAPAILYRTADERLTTPPKWDGNDVRTVLSDSVVDGSLGKPVLAFSKGYISNHVWVSGEPAYARLMLPISRDVFITLNTQSAVFSLELDDKHQTGRNGVLAGVLAVTDIDGILRPIASSAGFCPGSSLYDSVLKTAAKAPDVVISAPKLQNTLLTCDGISVGIGFEVVPVQPSTVVMDPLPPRPGKCDDAG